MYDDLTTPPQGGRASTVPGFETGEFLHYLSPMERARRALLRYWARRRAGAEPEGVPGTDHVGPVTWSPVDDAPTVPRRPRLGSAAELPEEEPPAAPRTAWIPDPAARTAERPTYGGAAGDAAGGVGGAIASALVRLVGVRPVAGADASAGALRWAPSLFATGALLLVLTPVVVRAAEPHGAWLVLLGVMLAALVLATALAASAVDVHAGAARAEGVAARVRASGRYLLLALVAAPFLAIPAAAHGDTAAVMRDVLAAAQERGMDVRVTGCTLPSCAGVAALAPATAPSATLPASGAVRPVQHAPVARHRPAVRTRAHARHHRRR